MGDGPSSPESNGVVKPAVGKKAVGAGSALLVGALLAPVVSGCLPPPEVSSGNKTKTSPDKVQTIPTPPSALVPDTTIYPYPIPVANSARAAETATAVVPSRSNIDKEAYQIVSTNLSQLQPYLGLDRAEVEKYIKTGSNEGIKSFEVYHGLIIVMGGENGYKDQESVNAIKDALDDLTKMGVMNPLLKLGLKAIARSIPGYGPEGFFGKGAQKSFSFSFDPLNTGIMLDNPNPGEDPMVEIDVKDKFTYLSGLAEEAGGINLWPYRIVTPNGYFLSAEHTFTGEERTDMIGFVNRWIEANKSQLDSEALVKTYQYLQTAGKSGYQPVFQYLRAAKALFAARLFEKKYEEGKIPDKDYAALKEWIYYHSLLSVFRDLADASSTPSTTPQAISKKN